MEDLAAGGLLHLFHPHDAVGRGQDAFIGDLAAAFGVEGGLIENDHDVLVLGGDVRGLAVGEKTQNLRRALHGLIAHKLGLALGELQLFFRPGGTALVQVVVPAPLLLLPHSLLEFFDVHVDAFFFHDLPGQVDGEAVGVVEGEGFRAGKGLDVLGGSLIDEVHQQVHTLADGAVEGFFLVFDDFLDIRSLFGEFGVGGEVFVGDGVHHFIEEGLGDAQQASVTGGPAEQAAEDVAPSGVGGGDAVADHEGGGTDVGSDDPEGDVAALVLAVGDACNLGNLLHDVLDGVNLKEVLHALHDAGQTLQTHAGVDIGLGHPLVVAVAVGVKLGENKVPELHVPVAVAAGAAGGAAAAVLLAPVEVNFGTGAAGAGAVLPEVVLFAQTDDAGGVHAHFLGPDVEGFVVVLVDGDPQLVNGQLQDLGDILPGPGGGFVLEVVAEGKVAQHLKVGAVAGGLAHALDVRGADALLAGGDPGVGRGGLTQEVLFQRGHAGVDQQEAVVPLGDQVGAGQPGVALSFKEGEEAFPELIEAGPFH